MNKSEQAQAIAEIKERVIDCPKANQMDLEDIAFSKLDREKLLEIVDSQAQKIARSEHKKERVFQICHSYIRHIRKERETLRQKIAEQQEQIKIAQTSAVDLAMKCAEQSAEIEKLKSQYSHIVQTNRQRG